MMSYVISVRISDNLYKVLCYKAQKSGLSLSRYVRRKLIESIRSEIEQGRIRIPKSGVHMAKLKPKPERLIIVPDEG